MPALSADVQRILDLAPQYSKDATPAMQERDSIGKAIVRSLAPVLPSMAEEAGLEALNLQAEDGGRQGYFGPLPWVRVYSPIYSRRPTKGIYLVYLFAADGSRVYLSLNQGTSETRAGHQRTTRDLQGLISRAAQARQELGDLIESDGAAGTTMSIDLGTDVISGRDSLLKARAYEDANILAREYRSGSIPSDERLLADLAGMLPMLACLYGQDSTGTTEQTPVTPGTRPGRAARPRDRQRDAETLKRVELYAEEHAMKFLTDLGWSTIDQVGPDKLGYDLRCTNVAGDELHVEVKGTRTQGERVVLTANEVEHVRQAACPADHALYVLTEIRVSSGDEPQCSGGTAYRKHPWFIDNDDLIPTEYSYKTPQDDWATS